MFTWAWKRSSKNKGQEDTKLRFCRVESNVNKIQKQTTPDKHECTQSTISTSSKSSWVVYFFMTGNLRSIDSWNYFKNKSVDLFEFSRA